MIKNFRHRGLKKLFMNGDPSSIAPELLERLELMLSRLDAANTVQGMNMPGYRLHPLKGNLKGFWSVSVSGNVRLIFRLDNKIGETYDVDLIDYH